MLFLLGKERKTEHNTHFCMPLKPVFTRCCGNGVHFTDEPTGNLDSKASDEIVALLKLSNRKYKQTVLMITHNMEIAKQADRVLVMEDGRLLDDRRGR